MKDYKTFIRSKLSEPTEIEVCGTKITYYFNPEDINIEISSRGVSTRISLNGVQTSDIVISKKPDNEFIFNPGMSFSGTTYNVLIPPKHAHARKIKTAIRRGVRNKLRLYPVTDYGVVNWGKYVKLNIKTV